MNVLGVDVGGTTIKALPVAVSEAGSRADVLGEGVRRETPKDADGVLETIAGIAAGFPDAEAIGVAVPGIIDEPAGVAVTAAAFGWENVPIRDWLTEHTGRPVALGHDVRAGGLAEWRLGASRGAENALLVMLGTGIGSCVVVDGRLLTGGGYAGQLGHTIADPDGPLCGCGQRGCLGMIASARSVARRYAERSGDESVTAARVVAERALDGDTVAQAIWDEAVTALSAGLVTAVTLFGPEIVVLGGGLALAGDQLIKPVAEQLEERLTFQRHPRVVPAQLGDESGILGAALLAAERK
ncbi:ROK family protein [Flindersiella endophytica]